MAETQLIVTEERLNELMAVIFAECQVAVDGKSKVVESFDEIRHGVTNRLMQLFVKNANFSKEDFTFLVTSNNANPGSYFVDQFAGGGHIKILTLPLSFKEIIIFKLSILYQSFYIDRSGNHVEPSNELKNFYSFLVNISAKKTKRTKIFENRFIKVQDVLLEEERELIAAVNDSFKRR
ncbi:hypothetical protein EHI46_34280 [Rhizobium leguminosarum]|jgi:hypothetical protein|uniref:hypothetical protein n=1 Tax=Rhizobium leguminosarum TaxID=384 RepID=UPI000FF806CD|nr:hypothetical protein [Rhizobium leguminosarum]RWY63754.1 hypothetical protein EHI46_34280 [Rhizobium leguminosarum]